MPKAISNTSPLLYLYRIGVVEWLPKLFDEVWITNAIVTELQEGRRRGYDVPDPKGYGWVQIITPRSVPSEWLTLDLGQGELEAMALALENPRCTILLDDALGGGAFDHSARRERVYFPNKNRDSAQMRRRIPVRYMSLCQVGIQTSLCWRPLPRR
jgi:hypothetical protein